MAGPTIVQVAAGYDNNQPIVFASPTTVGNWIIGLTVSQDGFGLGAGWTAHGTWTYDPDRRLNNGLYYQKVATSTDTYNAVTGYSFGSTFLIEIQSTASSIDDLLSALSLQSVAAPGTYTSVTNASLLDGSCIIMQAARPGGTTLTAGSPGWTTLASDGGSNRISRLYLVDVAPGASVNLNQTFSGSEQEAVLAFIAVNAAPVSAEEVEGTTVDAVTVSEGPTFNIDTTQFTAYTVWQYAAETVYSDSLTAVSVNNKQSTRVLTSDMAVNAVVRGRVENPRLRAWTFVLDGHQFYVLRLGDDKTLLYDVSTEQWSWWSNADALFWRVTVGMNWRTPGNNAFYNGSNIIVGDDTYGLLWGLNPEQGYDESAMSADGAIKPFPRVATGQIITRGREFLGCFQVYLTASNGEPSVSSNEVSLRYSDDLGHTYVNAGAYVVEEGNYNQEFAWRSLGKIGSPGRLFQIVDNGAFSRIDGMSVDNGTTAS